MGPPPHLPPCTYARTVNSGQAEATVRVGFTIVAPTCIVNRCADWLGDFVKGDFVQEDFVQRDFVQGDFVQADFVPEPTLKLLTII